MPVYPGFCNASHKDHYSVLALPSPVKNSNSGLTQTMIKQAYHRALLLHHPDKSTKAFSVPGSTPLHTVDEITLAYQVLSDPKQRLDHDRQLVQQSPGSKPSWNNTNSTSLPGIDTVDLDDMTYDQEQKSFYRSCRCGKEHGFRVSESQLEEHEDAGEIVIGCQGCSLWLRITFGVAFDEA